MTGTVPLARVWGVRCRLYAEGDKLRAEGDKLWVEGDKPHAEAKRLWAEGDKLHAEADKGWAEAIIAALGTITLTWEWRVEAQEYACILSNGETFEPPVMAREEKT